MREESIYKLSEHDLTFLRRYGSFSDFLHFPAVLPGGFFSLFFSAGVKMARDNRMSHWIKMSSVFSFSFHN